MRARALPGTLALGLLLLAAATPAAAASAVFDGDPVEPGSGQPYEILPGQPLVTPGADGRLGTADDVVDPGTVGDVDLVLRLGPVPGSGAIPAPAPKRGGVFTGVAGARGAATAIPFTAYLSDGAAGPAAPYGSLLPAPDMDGLPVVVLLFADLDGDGVIGPTDRGRGKTPEAQVRALAELEPVGREVAFFAGGVASGSVVPTAGAPARSKGLVVVGTALAFTGAYDPGFLDGHVPTGPGITTAQPFLPERDPLRLFTSDIGPLTVDGTLNPAPRAAGLPGPGTDLDLALPADGSAPTVDTALVLAASPTCARLVERKGTGKHRRPPAPAHLALGTAGGARKAKLRLVAVDRLGSQTDPVAETTARIEVSGPIALTVDKDGDPTGESLSFTRANGRAVNLATTGAGTGEIRVRLGGALCQRIAYESRAERDRGGADARVGARRADFTTIAAAIAGAADADLDGRVTIEVAEGVYRECVVLDRPVELRGAGPGRTVIDARGTGAALAVADPAAIVGGLTASGGTAGVALVVTTGVAGLEARANVGPGFLLVADGAAAAACVARENGGEGFAIEAGATVHDSTSVANALAGIVVRGAEGAVVAGNRAVQNGRDGIEVVGAVDPVVTGNATSGNLERGLSVEDTTGGVLAGNRAAANDDDGLRLKDTTGMLVDQNDLTANGGWGMHLRSASADFDAAAGVQGPPGTNDVAGNESGAVLIE